MENLKINKEDNSLETGSEKELDKKTVKIEDLDKKYLIENSFVNKSVEKGVGFDSESKNKTSEEVNKTEDTPNKMGIFESLKDLKEKLVKGDDLEKMITLNRIRNGNYSGKDKFSDYKEIKERLNNKEEVFAADYKFQKKDKVYDIAVSLVDKDTVNIFYPGSFGFASIDGDENRKGFVFVRNDLPKKAAESVLQHELYHIQDEKKWLGALGRELRANFSTLIKNPIGVLQVIGLTLISKERINLYLDRLRKGY